jgi:clan AA aspartic protease
VIEGRVVGSQARVGVAVRRVGQSDVRLECVIDTGFEGALTLPAAAVRALGLPYLTDLTANLADDTDVQVDVHVATIIWDGSERAVAVLALGRRPLVGTALLAGRHLGIDFTEGGAVLIDPL